METTSPAQAYEALHAALAATEQQLRAEADSIDLLFRRACLREQTGADARDAYLAVLAQAPDHLGAMTNLANLCHGGKEVAEALRLYELAVSLYPGDPGSRANLGNLLLRSGETRSACEHYRHALRVDPDHRAAHAGLSLALEELGEPKGAAEHRARAFGKRCFTVAPYRGNKPPIPVLELIATTGGNVRTDEFVSDRIFQRIRVTPEFFDPGTILPPHQLVINAIGDADGAGQALADAQRLLATTGAPVINSPAAVLATGRRQVAERLAGVPGVRTARTCMVLRELLLGTQAGERLAERGFCFPLLLRTPGFHGGAHFVRVETPGQLTAAVEQLPGDELLLIEYLDAHASDGCSRKYRVMMVDGELYPLHLAISARWKIHYYTADMADSPGHRREEAGFLEDMPGTLGPEATAALMKIQAVLGLDYGGIDFGLGERGEVLLFEANATMTVVSPDKDPRWDYRRPAVERIFSAVERMLVRRAATECYES